MGSPGENPEASSTTIQDDTVLSRLTDKLACHMNKTLPYRLMVPDYSATSCGGPIPPCEDLETFRQIAGPDAGKERNCKWVIARNKCHRYGFQCPASCLICSSNSTHQPSGASLSASPSYSASDTPSKSPSTS